MILRIKPLDTLFFRTSRPFDMGAETFAEAMFPPSPATFYGALRTFLIFEKEGLTKFYSKGFKDKVLGTPYEKGNLELKGPVLGKENSLYFPAPADFVKVKRNGKEKLVPLILKDVDFCSDYPLEKCLSFSGEEKAEPASGFIENLDFKDYLEGKASELRSTPLSNFFKTIQKIGIKRDKTTFTSEEGYLYRIPMLEFKEEASFLIKVNDIESFPEKGVFTLGGEGKLAEFERLDTKESEEDPFELLKNVNFRLKDGMFKLYLATPAYFKKGWIPSWIDENKGFEGEFRGIKLKLVAVALKKFRLVGGWNFAKNEPKPVCKMVAEGSVYYFKVLDDSDEQRIKEAFHFKNISDIAENETFSPKEGFGLALVGGVL